MIITNQFNSILYCHRHTGVVVYGMEYFYGGMGIEYCPPVSYISFQYTIVLMFYYIQGGTIMGSPHKIEDLGETEIPQDVFMDYIFDLQDQFQ